MKVHKCMYDFFASYHYSSTSFTVVIDCILRITLLRILVLGVIAIIACYFSPGHSQFSHCAKCKQNESQLLRPSHATAY